VLRPMYTLDYDGVEQEIYEKKFIRSLPQEIQTVGTSIVSY
jgi:hypothetical protein